MIGKVISEHISRILNGRDFEVRKLAGDASDRTFYRLHFSEPLDGGADTAVLMVMGDVPADRELPFINIQRNMSLAGLPVPEIIHFSQAPPIMILQDLGDATLEDAISGQPENAVEKLYRRAVDLVVRIQVDGAEKAGEDCIALALAFDVEKLMYEFNFFYENAILKYKKREPPPEYEKVIKDGFLGICEVLSAEERVLTHRDYHSRNLMVIPGGEIYMVDFQDARMGPRQYDLVSLLLDSYAKLPESIAGNLYEYYFEEYERYSGIKLDREKFDLIYTYMAVQRSIKAAGSFAYLDVVKGKDRYLQYFPTVLGYARRYLDEREELAELASVLSMYVEELG